MIPKQFEIVHARFMPKCTDTMRPEMLECIGLTANFEYAWIMTRDDSEVYAGQWALTTRDPRFKGFWLPEEDLEIIKVVYEVAEYQN